jgi:hypothetical protein
MDLLKTMMTRLCMGLLEYIRLETRIITAFLIEHGL